MSSLTDAEAALLLTLLAVVFLFVVFMLLLARFSSSIAAKGRVPVVVCSKECSCVQKEVEEKKSEYVIDMMPQPQLMIADAPRIDWSKSEVNVEFPASDEDNGIRELDQTDDSSTETEDEPETAECSTPIDAKQPPVVSQWAPRANRRSTEETSVHPRPVCSLDGHQKSFADSAAFWRRQTEKPHVKFADPVHVSISASESTH
ncbi:hypothetical protein M3Y94_01044800 [Aphelenchoides besseyi]|nr:hypothetical protein M3Y94_01044800 [Aphelenchoides besseyi]KAI6224029.1 hypothetical protein M3Y95_00839800 [Aphelenchoides besseyi]